MPANNTIHDYLSWRGDLTFSTDPFNEVDNLILAQLAYVDYDEIVSDDREEKISIGDVCRLYWELHTEDEVKKRGSFIRLSPLLLKPVANTRRFRKTMLTGYVNYINTSSEAQMSAVQFELEDGTIYVAFRGTDETLIGWKEDFNLSFMPRTEGQRLAVEYMKIYFRDSNFRLRVGGHSKGGNFAIFASAFSGTEVERQIMQIYTNDGPGFREEVTQTPEYQRVLPKVISIIPGDSVIGRLFGTGVSPHVIKSSAFGILQHDALTWQVMGNRFVTTERTDDSQFVEKMLTDWLSKIDDESRRIFVDQIFNVLQAKGAYSLNDIKTANLRDLVETFQIAKSLPKDDQKEVMQVIEQLFRSGERTLYEQIENTEGSIPEFIRRWAAKRGDKIDRKQLELEQLMAEEEQAMEQVSEKPVQEQQTEEQAQDKPDPAGPEAEQAVSIPEGTENAPE